MNKDQFEFIISRTFDAPREKVWEAWTQEEQLKKWFGPKGCPIFHNRLDFRVGGIYHYGMKPANGDEFWGRWVFLEISEPERLTFIAMFSDEEGNITRHPWNENWPLKMYSTVTFEEDNGKTKVTVNWKAHEATDLEIKEFEDGAPSMQQGWSGTFEKLETYLAEV
jgi:uncharacterized protein YndB with AHSA1/START domain